MTRMTPAQLSPHTADIKSVPQAKLGKRLSHHLNENTGPQEAPRQNQSHQVYENKAT